jgi:hypothetical protein
LASYGSFFFHRREIRSNVLQLIRIADQVDCDDTARTVFAGHRIDRTIAFAQYEGADALNVGDTGTGGDAVEMYGGAPQSAMPQPNFVPVMPSTSRNTPRPFAHPRRIGRHHHYLALRRAHARAPLT